MTLAEERMPSSVISERHRALVLAEIEYARKSHTILINDLGINTQVKKE